MSSAPQGWGDVRLRDLVSSPPTYGSTAAALPYDSSLPRYVRITDMNEDGRLDPETRASILEAAAWPYLLESGDLLFARSGATVGKSYLYRVEDGTCAHAGYVIKFAIDPAKADRRYLAQWTRSPRYWVWVGATLRQGAQPNINAREYGALALRLPPLPEQRKIAEVLDTLDEAIRKTEQIIAKLKQVKQGLLHDLLTRGIDHNGELRDPDRRPEQFKDSELGRIPKEWEVTPLKAVAEVRSGLAKNQNREVRGARGVYYLRVANVQDGYLNLAEMSQIPIGDGELERFRVLPGDVLMNEGGDLDKLGRGAIWQGEFDPCVHQNHVFVVRCGKRIKPEFLNSWTGASRARSYFMVAGIQTTNLASISKTAISRMPLCVPALEEQSRIVDTLTVHAERLGLEARCLAKLQLLKQGLMEDLLTGKVRVTPLLDAESA